MKKNLELYIHIPFCMKKCSYCDFLSFQADEALQHRYITALKQEAVYYGKRMKEYEVSTIYIGGGTPSWLDQQLMLELLDVIGDSFQIDRQAEVSMECNPGTVNKSKLAEYRRNGINRLSIGLQSTDNEELKLLGRIHTYEQFLKTYTLAREADFHNINVDLMSGIPYQTLEKFAESLLHVIRLKPEHISVYSLIIEKGTPFYEQYKYDVVQQRVGNPTKMLPSEDEVYRIMKATQQLLQKYGYERYEISNYARPGYACKHNIGYWDRTEYLGLGLGAASLLGNIRYSNTRDIHYYIKNAGNIEEKTITNIDNDSRQCTGTNLHQEAVKLNRQDAMSEFMYLGLRKIEGVSRLDFENSFGISIDAIYPEVIQKLKQQGLLQQKEGRIFLTDRGLDVSNYAMAEFLL